MILRISRNLCVHTNNQFAGDHVTINVMCESTEIVTILARSNFTEIFCKKSRSHLLKIVYHLCDQVLQ
jgi:hypothetical protein